MGKHPGCPVCSIVAASLVAVETDVGETISALKSHFCVVSGLLELLRSTLCCSVLHSHVNAFGALGCYTR